MMRKLSRENYDAKIMTRKASPSVLLHKSEVTYGDTGVSKNTQIILLLLYSVYCSLQIAFVFLFQSILKTIYICLHLSTITYHLCTYNLHSTYVSSSIYLSFHL